MNNEDLRNDITALLLAAVDLGNSLQEDLKEGTEISPESVVLLNDFRIKHDALSTVLDILNGLQ